MSRTMATATTAEKRASTTPPPTAACWSENEILRTSIAQCVQCKMWTRRTSSTIAPSRWPFLEGAKIRSLAKDEKQTFCESKYYTNYIGILCDYYRFCTWAAPARSKRGTVKVAPNPFLFTFWTKNILVSHFSHSDIYSTFIEPKLQIRRFVHQLIEIHLYSIQCSSSDWKSHKYFLPRETTRETANTLNVLITRLSTSRQKNPKHENILEQKKSPSRKKKKLSLRVHLRALLFLGSSFFE